VRARGADWNELCAALEGREIFGPWFEPDFERESRRLQRATRALDVQAAARAAAALVGLGPGSTPAGDDFLIGWIAGLAVTKGGNAARASFLEKFRREVSLQKQKTHPLSARYLGEACELRFSERLADFVRAFAAGAAGWRAALDRVLATGHSSGAAAALGFARAALVWPGAR